MKILDMNNAELKKAINDFYDQMQGVEKILKAIKGIKLSYIYNK